MPIFNPNEPQNGETVDADLLRNNFNALNDKPAPGIAAVLTAGNNAGGQPITGVGSLILGTPGTACIQIYATGGTATVIAVESQAGNKAVLIRASENPGEPVGLTAVNAPLTLEGAAGVQVRGPVVVLDLPTTDPHVVNAVWNEGGWLRLSAG